MIFRNDNGKETMAKIPVYKWLRLHESSLHEHMGKIKFVNNQVTCPSPLESLNHYHLPFEAIPMCMVVKVMHQKLHKQKAKK